MQIGNGLVQVIAVFGILVAVVIGGLSWGAAKFTSRTIESATRIEPELKLTVKDNKVDTIYVYRRP